MCTEWNISINIYSGSWNPTTLSANINAVDVKGDKLEWHYSNLMPWSTTPTWVGKLFSVFTDLKSAFPRVWHYHVLQTLHDLGVQGQLSSLIKKYLLNRSFQVRISNTLSTPHPQANSIPQCSPLSNTLVIIAMYRIFNLSTQFSLWTT